MASLSLVCLACLHLNFTPEYPSPALAMAGVHDRMAVNVESENGLVRFSFEFGPIAHGEAPPMRVPMMLDNAAREFEQFSEYQACGANCKFEIFHKEIIGLHWKW